MSLYGHLNKIQQWAKCFKSLSEYLKRLFTLKFHYAANTAQITRDNSTSFQLESQNAY